MTTQERTNLIEWLKKHANSEFSHHVYDRESVGWFDADVLKHSIPEIASAVLGITLSDKEIQELETFIYHQTYTACSHYPESGVSCEWVALDEMIKYLPEAFEKLNQ